MHLNHSSAVSSQIGECYEADKGNSRTQSTTDFINTDQPTTDSFQTLYYVVHSKTLQIELLEIEQNQQSMIFTQQSLMKVSLRELFNESGCDKKDSKKDPKQQFENLS